MNTNLSDGVILPFFEKELEMKGTNQSLTGLRGLLALSVVIYHIFGSAILEGYLPDVAKESPLYWINYAGPISVNLFFVISGLLITQSLLNKRTLGQFALNRIWRIYPVFITIHIIIFAVGPFIGYKWMDGIGFVDYITNFITNALLLPGIFPLPIAQIVAWSLSYELFFYIIAGLAWFGYRNERLSMVSKWVLYAFVIGLSIVIVVYHSDFLFFAVGVLLFICQNKLRNRWKPNKIFYFNGLICFILMYVAYHKFTVPIAVALLLSFLLFIPIIKEYGLLSRVLRTGFMNYLGRISYSLYMWHTMVMFPLKIFVPKLSSMIGSSSLSFAIYAVLSLFLSIVVSHLSYQFIEQWLTGQLKLRIKRKDIPAETGVIMKTS
ncbi:acyltransferase family protein [Bacillus sp. FSL K6-6540]|uniref:acyltransferase family protein n=1 Tax=Bacillus sp. FSL K6-6540 TaxID=2921512 RepID=UPI0030F92B62